MNDKAATATIIPLTDAVLDAAITEAQQATADMVTAFTRFAVASKRLAGLAEAETTEEQRARVLSMCADCEKILAQAATILD